ncbi:septum-promoting GTP-binding protein 1-like [Populus nigra]|uniref:septum-promoting GTP-binding protein 1-like n=1 Tax=Populus nigra TaxID=3691 RepID=UPI002B26A865|nr:septum-promoting GTP-binding protein 1-like [Populus nigra]
MNQFCQIMFRFNPRRKIQRHISIIRRCILRIWDHLLICSLGKPVRYRRMLSHQSLATDETMPSATPPPTCHNHHDNDSDLVALKISLLGDCQIGKTSFLEKYVGNEKDEGVKHNNGLKLMKKTLMVKDARISYSLWELDGDEGLEQQIPVACKGSVAILIMFDLTSRVTLNSVIRWYQEARRWNQTAVPVIIGTKFDDFIQLPIDLQWTIASQARAYAKVLNATLFFSSATYNINVNKIFKFITAKLFDLPWTLERNLTIGEPIIDF